eukprot:3119557-Lingulodinium_polyedra.AAC.1
MVDRPLTSIPSVLYEFVARYGSQAAMIPPGISEELRVAAAFALIAQHDWRWGFAPFAYVKGACPTG